MPSFCVYADRIQFINIKLVVDVNGTGREKDLCTLDFKTELNMVPHNISIFLSLLLKLNYSKCPIVLLQRRLFECGVSNSFVFSFSKRVRFKTEGHNNHLQLIAVRLSFRWLRKLHILFGHHKTP